MQKNQLLYRFFPFLQWLKDYHPVTLKNDAIAGLTVAAVLIPQSMAYAILAGLPPVYGLYASVVAPMLGAMWGSLRQMATGPIAIMSLLVLTTLSNMAEPGSPHYIDLAFLLALMVGVLYLAIGLFKFGEIMSFISHSAVKGFTAAAALIITATQLPNFMGLEVARHEYIFQQLLDILICLPGLHLPTVTVGVTAFIIIYGIKYFKPAFPASIAALVLTTIATYAFRLHEKGVAIVGNIPEGLPVFHVPAFDLQTISSLIGPAVVIALVSFAETYSVGKTISSETKQKLNVDQEFIGQGLANLIGSFFQSYPVSGSFSRTAINYASGAKTGISSAISSVCVVLALLFLTPLFTYIPKAALAAMVISAVLLLFHPKAVFDLWKMNHHDGIVAITVFVISLIAKPDYALLIGVMISLMFFLWKTMHPRIVRVTKDPKLNMFVNADIFQLPSCPQILQLRSDNVIYFANAEYTTEHIIKRMDAVKSPVKFLLLDLQAMSFIDITGIDELKVLMEDVKSRNFNVAFMGVRQPVMQTFKQSGLLKDIEPELLIEHRGDAITVLFRKIDHEYCKNKCPFELFHECSSVK
ncbi:MAG: SulP family inorganic anion transporter [Gammaproteobacteria bacterium]|nr:MAG: SulP family inorganic anion transporter [Gammaproteobacteria bacterium]